MSNIAPALAALQSSLKEYGRDSVKSSLAKPKMALAVIEAAVNHLVKADNADEIYDTYKAARAAEIAKHKTAAGTLESAKSDAANTSKVRAHINWGNTNLNAYDIAETVIELRSQMIRDGGEAKDCYQALYDVAVQHNKNPGKVFTNDELVTLIGKPGKKDKSDLDRMTDEYKRLYKLALGTEEQPGIAAMVPVFESICQVFDAAGIARPAMTKDEKKEEEAIAFLAQRGRIATPSIDADDEALAA